MIWVALGLAMLAIVIAVTAHERLDRLIMTLNREADNLRRLGREIQTEAEDYGPTEGYPTEG